MGSVFYAFAGCALVALGHLARCSWRSAPLARTQTEYHARLDDATGYACAFIVLALFLIGSSVEGLS